MTIKRILMNGASAAALSATLAACGSAGQPAASTKSSAAPPPAAVKQLSVKLDYTPLQGYMLPLIVAIKEGYYKKLGLNVSLSEGSDATSTISSVSAGHYDIGFTDAGQTALAISKGAQVKMFAVYLQKTQGVVISKASLGLTTPQSLIGKTVASTPGSSSGSMFDAMLKIAGISQNSVNIQSVSSPTKVPSLLTGKVDAITGFASAECIQAKQSMTVPVNCMGMGNFGVSSLGEGLLANDSFIVNNPTELKDFVEATNSGLDYAIKNPATAAEMGVNEFPLTKKSLLEAQFVASVPLLHTTATQGKPYGYMAGSDWTSTLQFLHEYRGLAVLESPSHYYVNVIQ